MKSCIHFIRHGETEGTEKKWYYGAADIPLSKKGVEDTQRLAREGIYPSKEDAQFFVSPLGRAKETLQIIYGDVDYIEIPDLKEMNFGIYECKPYEETQSDQPFIDWCNDITGDFQIPEGESRNQFAERISRGLTLLRKYHGLKEISHRHSKMDANTIMVFHGGAISACMTLLFPQEEKTIWDWCPKPGHGYTVYFEQGEPVRYEEF